MTDEGIVIVDKLVDDVWQEARIEEVLYVLDVRKNLFSVGMCTSRGYTVMFRKNDTLVMQDHKIVATGKKQSNKISRLFSHENTGVCQRG